MLARRVINKRLFDHDGAGVVDHAVFALDFEAVQAALGGGVDAYGQQAVSADGQDFGALAAQVTREYVAVSFKLDAAAVRGQAGDGGGGDGDGVVVRTGRLRGARAKRRGQERDYQREVACGRALASGLAMSTAQGLTRVDQRPRRATVPDLENGTAPTSGRSTSTLPLSS